MKTILLMLLAVLNMIQFYIIVTMDSRSVTEVLLKSANEKFGEIFYFLNASDATAPVPVMDPTFIPRPNETETPPEKKKIKWSQSADRLQYLAKNELTMYKMMKEYKFEMQLRLSQISSWMEDYESSSVLATQHLSNQADVIQEITAHPFLALRMLQRFSQLKELVARTLSEQVVDGYIDVMENATDKLPDETDYEDAMWNIINLRYVYDLNVTDLINGKLKDTQTKIGLTQEHIHDIAFHARNNSAFTEAVYWYDALLELLKLEDTKDNNDTIAQIEHDMAQLKEEHDELHGRITDDNFWLFPHRFSTPMSSTPKHKLLSLKQYILQTHNKSDFSEYEYHEICDGQSYLTELEKSKLTCFLDKSVHPYWLINPLKVEVYSWEPYLIRIYDVLGESMIQYLVNSSKVTLGEAEVVSDDDYNKTDPRPVTSKSRIGLATFLQQKSDRLQNLYLRVSQMTGLACDYSEFFPNRQNPVSAEDIQIASYAFGGHYEYHYDYLLENHCNSLEGNRLATFMIYLNDVALGGYTAFPKVGTFVKPIRNSAVLWYNLHRNGNEDVRTLHGGCPVILGQKWIANVWIRSFASFQRRKCSLNPDE